MLAYLESLHFACVSVEKWDMKLYAERYPRALRCHSLVDTPAKVKKFLMGRQFFVIFVVFLLAQITSFPKIPPDFLGLPYVFILIFIQTGLPGIALTLTFGQLIGQIYVEEFTVQLLNLPGCEFIIRLSLGAEYIGITNFGWILFGTASRLMCKKIRRIQKSLDSMKSTDTLNNTDYDEPVSPTELNRGPNYDSGMIKNEDLNWFDYLKYVWSTIAVLGSLLVICYGISIDSYVLPTPPAAAFIIAFCLLVTLFYLEGLMIAIVGTQYWDRETFREAYPRAYRIHEMMSLPDNVKRFVIGRQFFTVLTNFVLAQIFTFANFKAGSYNKILFYIIVQSGLVGVMVILNFAQLFSELLAAAFPLRFLNMRGSYSIAYISLFFDLVGVGHCAWAIYYGTRWLFCRGHIEDGRAAKDTKPDIVRVQSAEVLAVSTTNTFTNP